MKVQERKSRDELKRLNRMSYIKMATMVGFVIAIIAFGSIAWFTMSREVEGTGTKMTAHNQGFELQVDGTGEIGFSQLYSNLENAIKGNSGTITNNEPNGQFIRWRMADGDDQLSPDAEGALEFKVISKGADISKLHYNLNIRSFVEKPSTIHVNGDTQTTVLSRLDEITADHGSASEKLGANYLKGHILFFKGRHGTAGNYQYFDFIDDPTDFALTLDENGNTVIYWIWVNTFGQIALTSDDTKYIKNNLPVLYEPADEQNSEEEENNENAEPTDREKITAYLSGNADNIFHGTANHNYSATLSTLYTKREASLDFQTEFDTMSDGYNAADQLIGGYIDYALVQLTAKNQE